MLFVTKWMEPWMEPEIHQVKWNKPGLEKQMLHVFCHVRNLGFQKKKKWK
jgi:hypothetical protein